MAASKTEIAYFEARLTESLKCSARAAGQCSKAAHAGLARVYRLEPMELRNCSDIALSGTALVNHQTSGDLEGASAFSSWSIVGSPSTSDSETLFAFGFTIW